MLLIEPLAVSLVSFSLKYPSLALLWGQLQLWWDGNCSVDGMQKSFPTGFLILLEAPVDNVLVKRQETDLCKHCGCY